MGSKQSRDLAVAVRTAVRAAKNMEQERVAAIIEAEAQQAKAAADDRAWREKAGLPPRVKPSDFVAARRAARSNGMPAEETEDTIGRLWAWGFLDGGQMDSDLLRDAGRRYAASYWRRYGPVCAKGGHYEEMTGRSATGPSRVLIPDEEKDLIAEDRFRRRDQALREVKAKGLVDQVCVDGAGDNDPAWLVDVMNGFPSETRQERLAVVNAQAAVGRAQNGDGSLEWAQRKLSEAERALRRKERQSRIDLVPHKLVELLVLGLSELARIDRADGFHRPKRGRPKKEDE